MQKWRVGFQPWDNSVTRAKNCAQDHDSEGLLPMTDTLEAVRLLIKNKWPHHFGITCARTFHRTRILTDLNVPSADEALLRFPADVG